jgi:hypothetical protein
MGLPGPLEIGIIFALAVLIILVFVSLLVVLLFKLIKKA